MVQLPSDPIRYKEAAVRALVGSTVITRYNNRTYKIDDIDFNASPNDEFTDERGIPSTFTECEQYLFVSTRTL